MGDGIGRHPGHHALTVDERGLWIGRAMYSGSQRFSHGYSRKEKEVQRLLCLQGGHRQGHRT